MDGAVKPHNLWTTLRGSAQIVDGLVDHDQHSLIGLDMIDELVEIVDRYGFTPGMDQCIMEIVSQGT